MRGCERVDLPAALTAEAKECPSGWVYEIVGDYDADGGVPPTAVRGAWKADDEGQIVGEFLPRISIRQHRPNRGLSRAGQVLEIPVPFSAFHDEELVDYTEEALASSFYAAWNAEHRPALAFGECVGYRTSLFLGGRDDISHLELPDIDVYWTIMGQLRLQTSQSRLGAEISEVRIEDR